MARGRGCQPAGKFRPNTSVGGSKSQEVPEISQFSTDVRERWADRIDQPSAGFSAWIRIRLRDEQPILKRSDYWSCDCQDHHD